MKPILKWTGGKSSELNIIKENMPKKVTRFVEPFLGGGAVYFDLENNESIVNDFNKELIAFYKILNTKSYKDFKKIIQKEQAYKTATQNFLLQDFEQSAKNLISEPQYLKYLEKEFKTKNALIQKIVEEKGSISDQDKQSILNTAVFAALYYRAREKYNQLNKISSLNHEHIAYWFMMRELSYSGMFRYSSKGDFNVPYGGQSYNSKNMQDKINYIEQVQQMSFYQNTVFENLDFKDFFVKYDYFKKDDFIFLDPPYDSEFSQYNKEEDFDAKKQQELKDTLRKTKANIMVVIKETEFILNLYKKDFNIKKFGKNYSVNMKNRNDKDVTHLIITNY